MKNFVLGLMALAALAFVVNGAEANCGKCGNDKTKCNMQQAAGQDFMADSGKPACGMAKKCCENCGKEGMCTPDKKCCDKCSCKDGKCGCCGTTSCKMKQTSSDATAQDVVVDPVCGMDVPAADAKFTYEFEGKTYHFCNESCMERFKKDPSKFIGK